MRHLLNVFVALFVLLSNLAYANTSTCYAPSPNLSALGDDYYDLERNHDLSNDEQGQINAFFNAMAGKWKGDAHYTECRGPDRAPIIKSGNAAISSNIQLSAETVLSIVTKKHDVEQRIKKSEHLSLLGGTPVFSLSFESDSHLIFSEKFRRLNKPVEKPEPVKKPSVLRKILNKITGRQNTSTSPPAKPKFSRISETIYDIQFVNGLLLISRSYYTNGVFTGGEQWQLSRD